MKHKLSVWLIATTADILTLSCLIVETAASFSRSVGGRGKRVNSETQVSQLMLESVFSLLSLLFLNDRLNSKHHLPHHGSLNLTPEAGGVNQPPRNQAARRVESSQSLSRHNETQAGEGSTTGSP